MERWPSGLRQQFTKLPGSKGPLEFESLSLRIHKASRVVRFFIAHFLVRGRYSIGNNTTKYFFRSRLHKCLGALSHGCSGGEHIIDE